MAQYAALRRHIDMLEAQAAAMLAQVVDAYTWPEELPQPERRDTYGVQHIGERAFGEDLTSELAIAHRSSEGAARYLVNDIADLTQLLPSCWNKVISAEAPLWQARRVAQACTGLDETACGTVDAIVAPGLGALGMPRLTRLTNAAVTAADPGRARLAAELGANRCVRTGGDKLDPLTGWVSARLDRADALYLDATVQLLADTMAAQGDTTTLDQRRARALGLLANPAAAVQLVGIPTIRGLDPAPETEQDKQALITAARKLTPALTPRTQVYVHLFAGNLHNPDAIARLENIGPLLISQIAAITAGTHIRLTPAIHLNTNPPAVDSYEIPARIRDQVLLRDTHSIFPWSATESRRLDLDHTNPWQPGQPSQTSPANLGPLTRHAHRIKTHAGWQLGKR